MKPHIKLDPTRPGRGKWQCESTRIPYWGGIHVLQGKGYSPIEAYRKWLNGWKRISETIE